METKMAKWKQDRVQEMVDLIQDSQSVVAVSIEGVPAPIMNGMRNVVRETGAKFTVAKIKLIQEALRQAEIDDQGFLDAFQGQVGLVTYKGNVFKLFQLMQGTISPAPAKGGDVPPEDIIVPAGETPFPAGPMIGTLNQLGFKATTVKGQISLRSAKIVPAGAPLSADMAQVLTKMGITPFEVGLITLGGYEDGTHFGMDVLDLDYNTYFQTFQSAAGQAFNLAMFIAYPSEQTTEPLIQSAHMKSVALAIRCGIINDKTIEPILAKSFREMLAITAVLSEDALSDTLRAARDSSATAAAAVAPAAGAADGGSSAPVEEDDDEDEEVSEEDAAEGLGALFG